MGASKDGSDKMIQELMEKNKKLMSEKEELNSQFKSTMKKVKDLEEEVEDAVASAEAANMGKSAVERDWTERLVKTEQEWAQKLKRSEDERNRLLAEKDAEMKRQLEQSKTRHESEVEKLRADHLAALDKLRGEHERNMSSFKADYDNRLLKAKQDAESERARLEARWDQQMQAREAEFKQALAARDREHAAALADVQSGWRAQLDEAHNQFAEERALITVEARRKLADAEADFQKRLKEMEGEWATKLKAAEDAAQNAQKGLRAELDSKIEAINQRLQELVVHEAKRERKRAALAGEVESLREAAEEEFRRRCELERALREAASLFKRELFEKNEELAALQDDVRAMRNWQLRRDGVPQHAPSLAPPAPHPGAYDAAIAVEEGHRTNLLQRVAAQQDARDALARQSQCKQQYSGGSLYDETASYGGDAGHMRGSGSKLRASAESQRFSPGRPYSACEVRAVDSDVDFDSWHVELSTRLDQAMKKLTPMLNAPDPA